MWRVEEFGLRLIWCCIEKSILGFIFTEENLFKRIKTMSLGKSSRAKLEKLFKFPSVHNKDYIGPGSSTSQNGKNKKSSVHSKDQNNVLDSADQKKNDDDTISENENKMNLSLYRKKYDRRQSHTDLLKFAAFSKFEISSFYMGGSKIYVKLLRKYTICAIHSHSLFSD